MTYTPPRFIEFSKLELDDKTIALQIKDVKWGTYKDYCNDSVELERGNCARLHLNEDFYVGSSFSPTIDYDSLYLFGNAKSRDDDIISNIFDTPEQAQEVYNLLKSIEITGEETMKLGLTSNIFEPMPEMPREKTMTEYFIEMKNKNNFNISPNAIKEFEEKKKNLINLLTEKIDGLTLKNANKKLAELEKAIKEV